MLDPIINFFSRTFFLIGRGIGLVIAWLLWPFLHKIGPEAAARKPKRLSVPMSAEPVTNRCSVGSAGT